MDIDELSTKILINKITLMDKIDCEIETAEKSKLSIKGNLIYSTKWHYYNGKIQALQDLKQWIEDLGKEGE